MNDNLKELNERVDGLESAIDEFKKQIYADFHDLCTKNNISIKTPATPKWDISSLAKIAISYLDDGATDLNNLAPGWVGGLFKSEDGIEYRRELVPSALKVLSENYSSKEEYLNTASNFIDKEGRMLIWWLHFYEGACKWVDEVIEDYRLHDFTHCDTFTLLGKAQQLEAQSVFKRVLGVLEKERDWRMKAAESEDHE